MNILDRFILHKDLGKGSYGKVKLAEEKETGKYYALKFIAKESLKKRSQLIRVNREIRLLKMLNHPHIIKIYEADETESDIIMVMDYVPGGELFDYVQDKKRGLPEAQAITIFCQILSAIEYCHYNKIIHRDLKPENVLLDSEGRVKLIDFGFSNIYDPLTFSNTFCGSPYYAAPEVIEGQQYVGPEADIWSLGIILYILLSGRLPFVEDNLKKLCVKIKALDYTIPSWVSKGAKDLIRRLLTIDRRARITMAEVKNHYWLKEAMRIHFIHPLDVVPRRLPIIGVDELIIRKLESYNFFPRETLLTRIFNDTDSPQFACYYLLKERFLREMQRQSQKQHVIIAEKHLTPPDNCLISNSIAENAPSSKCSEGRRCMSKAKLASNAIQPFPIVSNNMTASYTPKPDLELFTKNEAISQDMVNYLGKIPQIISLVTNTPYKYQCCTHDVIFTVELVILSQLPSNNPFERGRELAKANWFTPTTSGSNHVSVYIQRLQGDMKSFCSIRHSIINHFM